MKTSPVFACLRNPSMVDYTGRLAAVFFTAGCNFSCGFCHNAELMGKTRPGMSWEKLEQTCRQFDADWVKAAVISGGEPTLDPELPELIAFLKAFGWAVKLDTNGSNPAMLARCLPPLDYVAMDIKTSLVGYQKLTGWPDTNALKTSIRLIKDKAPDYEFRTTLIEGVHDPATLAAMVPQVEGATRYVLQPFIPSDTLPDARFHTLPRTSTGFMDIARKVFEGHVQELVVRGA